ncbi:MAG: guanylate kinase [Bacilli bacterium]|nr:guanylate kinase [Bacilli bacterium]
MIKTQKKGSLIIISGTTCAGKGTVIKELLTRDKNLYLSISYTSRPMRGKEQNGKDYYFVTPEEFEAKIKNNEFLEYAQVQYGCYYGTPKKEIETKLNAGLDVILEIDVLGAKQIKEQFPETILIFIMAPSMEIVKERIKARNTEDADQIIKRFRRAYQEINEINKYNYVVINDNLEDAVKKVESILISEKCRVDRIEEIEMENEEEIIHEFLMQKDNNL